ncbi:helix-turn-helix domain-containing protein [Flavivirga aquimarina]|uniref:Helix-turn-helix domain-containing protein n=1 Tax=Flavivirga aquimarina TaxID=2027862 RepID=A0ABT8W5H3_9FLAO|nr:helix-turn-helix domain-containing protein [Flavivirga aquimarina]MDO5968365.1 helix-turn-helix domain-containing protein [Flavivirga aquimarina]
MNNEEIYFNLNPVNFFIVSGLVQNFILAGILFFRKAETQLASRFLSITIFIVNAHITYLMVLDTNFDTIFPTSLWVPYSYLTAIGPLIYFYTQALINTNFNISSVQIKHFIPVMVEVALQTVIIVDSSSKDQMFYNSSLYFYIIPLLYTWTAGSILYYLHLSLDIINDYDKWVFKNFSNLKEITLKWLRKFIVYYRLLWMIWIPVGALFLLFFRFQLQYLFVVLTLYVLILLLTYLTLWIGLEGLGLRNFVFIGYNSKKVENKNFRKLTHNEIQEYVERITKLMVKEKIYLNENLSLKEMSSYLEADPNLISFILNNHLEKNFYDFINSYRIEEVKNKLNDANYKDLTLLGIALESGFNSKTTFNRVFKKVTGITPTKFQKERNTSLK